MEATISYLRVEILRTMGGEFLSVCVCGCGGGGGLVSVGLAAAEFKIEVVGDVNRFDKVIDVNESSYNFS
jgi:hypothetical protein